MSSITFSTFEKDFSIEKRLGKGNCATVSLAYHKPSEKYYAVKISQLKNMEELSHAFNEIQTMNSFDDPWIIKVQFPSHRFSTFIHEKTRSRARLS